MMFSDWNNFNEDEEILDVIKRYQDMLVQNNNDFFDLSEFECIIDYYADQLNFKDAIKAVKLALRLHSYSSSLKLKYIQLLIETGKPGKALGLIRSITDAESTNCELFLAKGFALNLTGKFQEAQLNFNQALKLCIENKDDMAYSIAQSFIQVEKISDAIRYLLLACEFNRENILVLYDLAQSYEKLDQFEESIHYYLKYLDLDPFAENVWCNLGMLYSNMEDAGKAHEAFDFAIALNPNYYSAYFNKAELFIYDNNLDGAISVYTDLLNQDGANIRALCELGNCFEESGNYPQALHSYNQALLISQDCADAWFGKGMIHYRQKKFRLSISSFNKAVNLQSANSDYWFMLGEAFTRIHKLDQAIMAYSKAAELNPYDFEAWMACAHILFRKKRFGEAVTMLISLYQRNQENPTINYRLAAYHVYLRDYANACKYFERGIRLNFPEHKEMFKLYPKTKAFSAFHSMIENHLRLNGSLKVSNQSTY